MKWDRNEIARTLAAIGLACVVAGFLRYSIQNELLRASEILLIAGGVLLLAAIVILAVLNFLGFRHSKRFDLTSEKIFSLSDQTRKVVGGLQQDVTVIRFARPSDAGPDAQHFDDLMVEYKHLSPHFKFQEVNPQEKPDIAQQYGAKHFNDVVVASGAQKLPLEGGVEGSISEADVTNAILKVTRNTEKKVCFVTGHGEKSLDDTTQEGYGQMAQNLKKETYTTDTINLVSGKGVPSDCDVD